MTSITLASQSIANCANSDSIDVQNTDSESKAESNKPTECQTRKQRKFIHALAEPAKQNNAIQISQTETGLMPN